MSARYYGRASRAFAGWFTGRSACFIRGVAYYLIVLGVFLFADAAYDEFRGVASVMRPGARYPRRIIIKQEEDPQNFKNLMFYEWARGPLMLCAGSIILGIWRHADRIDPFSRNFAGNARIDELSAALTKEEERRHRPLR